MDLGVNPEEYVTGERRDLTPKELSPVKERVVV